MLALYTYWRSSASYRARIALNLKGLEYEARPVHILKGEQKAADYHAVNPQHRVPALVHDGRVLTQSLAIIEYLDEQFPQPALLPKDSLGRARVRSLSLIPACEIQPLQNSGTGVHMQAALGLSAEQIAAWRVHWNTLGLQAYEDHLVADRETGRFSHGDTPTMADCFLVPQCYAARRLGIDIDNKYPTIARIEAACAKLEAFQRAHPDQQPDRA
jgi:maleylacetoacetate isomerase